MEKNAISFIEEKYKIKNQKFLDTIKVGNIIEISYKITEGEKERLQLYEGIIISKQNRGLGKSFTIRRTLQGIGIEQIFLVYSPKIEFIKKKLTTKVRRAKLYFLRSLIGKSKFLKSLPNS